MHTPLTLNRQTARPVARISGLMGLLTKVVSASTPGISTCAQAGMQGAAGSAGVRWRRASAGREAARMAAQPGVPV